jgi:hypothetical protein
MDFVITNQDIIIKIIGSIIALIALPKYYNELKFLKKDKLKDDYKFAEQIIKNDNYKELHDFLLEQAFYILFNYKFSADEIKYFLEQNNPMKKLTNFMKYRLFLEIILAEGKCSLKYQKKFEKLNSRRWFIFKSYISYIFFALCSFIPLAFIDKIKHLPYYLIFVIIIFSILSFIIAISSLNDGMNLKNSHQLIEECSDIQIANKSLEEKQGYTAVI